MVPKVLEAFLDAQQYSHLSNCQSGSWNPPSPLANEFSIVTTFSNLGQEIGVAGLCLKKIGANGMDGRRRLCPVDSIPWITKDYDYSSGS